MNNINEIGTKSVELASSTASISELKSILNSETKDPPYFAYDGEAYMAPGFGGKYSSFAVTTGPKGTLWTLGGGLGSYYEVYLSEESPVIFRTNIYGGIGYNDASGTGTKDGFGFRIGVGIGNDIFDLGTITSKLDDIPLVLGMMGEFNSLGGMWGPTLSVSDDSRSRSLSLVMGFQGDSKPYYGLSVNIGL